MRYNSTIAKGGSLRFLVGITALIVFCASNVAMAVDYPKKPISWVVTWPAGGGADTATRVFTQELEKVINGTIVINNVVGGGASIGYMTAKQSANDGYTLVTAQGDLPKFSTLGMAPIAIDDFEFIAGFAVQSVALIVKSDSPWATLEEFVEDARRHPGQRTIGVSDIGGVHHQPVILWAKEAGINVRAIAHDGSPQMNAAILGGHVDMIASYIRPAAPYVNEGQLRFLAYFGPNSPIEFPEIPTVKSLGYDVVWEQPYGIGVPAGAPEEIKTLLAEASETVWANPDVEKGLANIGLELYPKSGAELKQSLENMQAGMVEILRILKEGN